MAAEPLPPRRRELPPWPLAAICIVAVIAASVVAAVAVHRSSQLKHTESQTSAVASVAGQLSDALLSYSASDLARSRARVLALSTPAFASTYDQDFSQALSGTITALAASASATVRDVYVDAITGGTAKAIVVVDFQTNSKAGTRKVLGTYLQLDLVRQGGAWKVDSVTVLSATSETQTTTPAHG